MDDSCSSWTLIGADIEGSYAGISVTLSLSGDGKSVAIGSCENSGQVRVFTDME